jgi:hypothetical protein
LADNLADRQPAIVINMGDTVHVVSMVTLRLLARGEEYGGDVDEMIRLLATAIVQLMDDQL